MVVDGPDGDEDVDVAVTNGQEMDKEENENADFEIFKFICLFLNLLQFYSRIFVAFSDAI